MYGAQGNSQTDLPTPSNASRLFVNSTSAADTTPLSVYLEGTIDAGYPWKETVVLTGTTAVGTTRTDWIAVTKFYLSAVCAGVISLYEDSGVGTLLSVLPAGQTEASNQRVALYPTPTSAIQYAIEYERELTDLVNSTDVPILPVKFHQLLTLGARVKEYEKTDNTRYVQTMREYQRGLVNLKWWVFTQAVGTPNLRGQGVFESPSRLGAWYPSVG